MTKARNLADNALTTVSPTELGFLDGVTSAVQTQIDGKTGKSTLTTTGDIYYASAANTPARIGIGSTSQVLTVAGGIPSWAAPAGGGKVLQVVSATHATSVSTNSGSDVDSGLTATITPTLNTSKILVMMSAPIRIVRSAGHPSGIILMKRGGTDIIVVDTNAVEGFDVEGGTSNSDRYLNLYFSYQILDSPATTSATTYKLQIRSGFNTTMRVNYPNATSSIILMEIGA